MLWANEFLLGIEVLYLEQSLCVVLEISFLLLPSFPSVHPSPAFLLTVRKAAEARDGDLPPHDNFEV